MSWAGQKKSWSELCKKKKSEWVGREKKMDWVGLDKKKWSELGKKKIEVKWVGQKKLEWVGKKKLERGWAKKNGVSSGNKIDVSWAKQRSDLPPSKKKKLKLI